MSLSNNNEASAVQEEEDDDSSSLTSVDLEEDQQKVQDDDDVFSYKGIPETDASLLSRLVFFWIRPLFRRAAQLHKQGKALQHGDLLPLPEIDHGSEIGPAFEQAWRNQEPNKKSTVRLRKALRAVIGKRLIAAGFIRFLNTCLQFAFPLLLNAILQFIQDTQAGRDTRENLGYWLSLVLFFAMFFKAISENVYFHVMYRAGYQARVAVSVSVYGKALRLASSERQNTTLGELVNLMQVDATKIEMFVPQIHVLWDGMLQIVGYMAILYTLIGWPCFAGLAVMVFSAPVQGKIMGQLFGLNRQMVKYTDERVKSTNEALQGIRCVKMYTWEEAFLNKISATRSLELGYIKSASYLRGFSRAYMEALPGLVAVTSFIVLAVATDNSDKIEASTLFAALVAFNQLRFPLLFYPMTLAQLAQAHVSAVRVENFLSGQEVSNNSGSGDGVYNAQANDECDKGQIDVQDAAIYWSDPSVPIVSSNTDEISKSSDTETQVEDSSGATVNEKERPIDSDLEGGDDGSVVKTYPKPILSNVSLKVAPGELCAVVGRVGCGKSTLCSAILNDSVLGSGKIALAGSIAYAAQSPWVLNATLRDNILFGLPYEKEKYDRVIEACQLTHDLALLDNGDLTEIGERGINLSGGQKQRVSVARAAYSEADIIILDDPLSALDPEVGKRLFDECVVGVMKGRTRLLVTNQLQCLRFCDTVVALGDGEVIEQGTYSELTNTEGGEVQRLLNELNSSANNGPAELDGAVKERQQDDGDEDKDGVEKEEGAKKNPAGLVTEEERNIGAVAMAVYRKYFLAGGGYLRFAIVYFGFILTAANTLINTVWISLWTADAEYERNSQAFYLGLFALTSVTLGFVTFMRSFLLARFGISASGVLHKNVLMSVLRAPMSFFDTTPTGRILSRFSKDMHSIDQEISEMMDFFLSVSLTVLVSIGTIIFVTPLFGIAVLPIAFVYLRVLKYFREVSRETKRLESISRSPVYAHFSETLGGLATIRAYGQPERFTYDFEAIVDQNTRAYYCNKAADRWLAVRLEFIGSTIAGLAAVFSSRVVISGQNSDGNFASLAGLSLTYAISLTSVLNWCVRTFAQLEASMNACERVLHYTENIPQEAPSTSDDLQDRASSSSPTESDPSAFAVIAAGGKAVEIENSWPAKGAITLNNLFMRYRSETPLVLKGLSVAIAGGERIGVVGRTGSGKSSLLLSLLRMVEPSLTEQTHEYEAPISIDGVDILRIGLRDLRSKLGIIPQNPVLFSGSIRSNVDPFDQYTDDQIWAALDGCGMRDAVECMPERLAAPVAEYGDNLSQGQRQLLCLGRALLKQCRVLLLDEATSSVDYETDREIQRTLREAFPGSTVLTIAHRVNTIMDSDKILVMKDGVAEEFAPPKELLGNDDSIFSQIVRHAEAESH